LKLGIRFNIVANQPFEEGIHAARMLFPRCWFDAVKCKAGLQALANYRREKNMRLGEFKTTPVHDWSSHAADAFRYMAVAKKVRPPADRPRMHRAPAVSGSMGWMA
jgi:hypothetical protein